MGLIVDATIVMAYISIAFELTMLHVPSIASFRSIWVAEQSTVACYSKKFQRLFHLSRPVKSLLFVPPLIAVYCVFLYPILAVVFWPPAQPLFSVTALIQIISVVLIVSGRLLSLAAVSTMLRKGDTTQDSGLLRSGPFRYFRNPGLTGMYVMFAGFWLALPTWSFLLGIVVYITYMHFKVRMEEDYLSHRFGSEFHEYVQSTRRYI